MLNGLMLLTPLVSFGSGRRQHALQRGEQAMQLAAVGASRAHGEEGTDSRKPRVELEPRAMGKQGSTRNAAT